jgi:hypothetical protein
MKIDNGKLSERVGRKVMGLRHKLAMTARLPIFFLFSNNIYKLKKERYMRKFVVCILVVIFLFTGFGGMVNAQRGPAPNSGDGVSDGSGFDKNNGSANGCGPAPNCGDGVSDGPGW